MNDASELLPLPKRLCAFVPGVPKGQPRARAFAFKGKARVFDPGTAESWKSQIALVIAPMVKAWPMPLPHEGPVSCDLVFYMPRPKRLMTKKSFAGNIPFVSKPDKDNLEKAVLDCLTTLGVWRDDSQVFEGKTSKQYAQINGQSGVYIEVKFQ